MALFLPRNQASENKWQVLIGDKLIEYDSCSQSDLETAKRENKNLKYIGSGEKRFLNGERYPSTLYYHFFVHTSDHDLDDTEPNL